MVETTSCRDGCQNGDVPHGYQVRRQLGHARRPDSVRMASMYVVRSVFDFGDLVVDPRVRLVRVHLQRRRSGPSITADSPK